MLDLIYYGWPYLGLGIAAVLAVLLFREKPTLGPSRWMEPAFAFGWVWPAYLIHQFEEHGIDLLGRRYAFLGEICETLGHADSCGLDPVFVLVVNLGLVWVGSAVAWFFRRSNPLLGVIMWGVPLVNAFAHLRASFVLGGYNAGLASSLVLFLPGAIWVLWAGVKSGQLRRIDVFWVVLAGVLTHVVLITSGVRYLAGDISYATLLVANGLNVLIPLGMGWFLGRTQRVVDGSSP